MPIKERERGRNTPLFNVRPLNFSVIYFMTPFVKRTKTVLKWQFRLNGKSGRTAFSFYGGRAACSHVLLSGASPCIQRWVRPTKLQGIKDLMPVWEAVHWSHTQRLVEPILGWDRRGCDDWVFYVWPGQSWWILFYWGGSLKTPPYLSHPKGQNRTDKCLTTCQKNVLSFVGG